ncbi:hypothetical protein, partial [Nitrobacter sp.]|uniref:hypothetical protein n=1 Tax=Nitrobacter sp. TaxID=29420 RepID=UPI003F653119
MTLLSSLPHSSMNGACILKYTPLRKRPVRNALVGPVSMAARCWCGVYDKERERHEDVEWPDWPPVWPPVSGIGVWSSGGSREWIGICG